MVSLLQALATVVASQALAQNAPPANRGEIYGRVVNAATRAALPTATVEITLDSGTASMGRATVTPSGLFRLQGLRLGRYRALIRALGYKPVEVRAINVTTAVLRADLGTITLTAAPLELQAVEVIIHRQDVQLAPDRNTFVVRDMPTTKGGNALDVLKNVPAVDVDIDNVVSLRGNAGVTIQINGRPSAMKPGPLGNFLSQLPADMVDKIEVIPNPSARDDPTGVAGIINIVLKEEADAGTSGGVTLSAGTTGQVNGGGNLGYENGPFTFYGSYGLLRDRRKRIESLFRENTYLTPVTYLDETGSRVQKPLAHTATANAAYKFGPHDDVSLDVLYSSRDQSDAYSILYRDLNASRSVTALNDRFTDGNGNESSFETSLGYKHGFAEKGHRLSAELSMSRDQEGGSGRVTSRALSLSGAPVGISAIEDQTAGEHPTDHVLKVDYVRPLARLFRMETGYKGTLSTIRTSLDTRVFDNAKSTFVPDPARINDFKYDQIVNAAYAMLSAQRGQFQLQGGVRAEHASTSFDVRTINATFDNAYTSLFPSALIAYNVDETHQVKVSYSRRIRRPDDVDVLDPTPHYADPLNLSQGNPNLKPEYINALELGLQQTGARVTVQVTPFWRHTVDAVRSFRTLDNAGVSTRTYANIATSDAYGGDATVALGGGKLTGFAGMSAFHQVSNAATLTPGLSINAFGWRARANGTYRFSKTVDVQALLSYQPEMTVEQGRTASRTQVNLAGRQKLMEDRLNLTIRIVDPFSTSRESSTTLDPRFSQLSDRARIIRGVIFGASWTFGKPKKDEKTDLIGGEP